MKWFEQQLDYYGSYHTKLVTKLTHFVGVPLVVFSLLIALAWFKFSFPPLFSTNFAWITVVVVSVIYIYLDWRLGLCLLVLLSLLSWLASFLARPDFTWADFMMFIAVFVAGWVIQMIGHFFEGKKPAFFANFIQLLIAPIFLVAEAAVMIGWRKDLHDVMQAHAEINF